MEANLRAVTAVAVKAARDTGQQVGPLARRHALLAACARSLRAARCSLHAAAPGPEAPKQPTPPPPPPRLSLRRQR